MKPISVFNERYEHQKSEGGVGIDYKQCASEILDAIGGRENLASAAHCATRLRLVIADNDKVKKETLENIDGVKGVFEAAGQLQIIIGTGTVNKVYDQFIDLAGVEAASKDDVKAAAAAKAPWYKRAIKTLGDIFVPIIPAIVATGLLCGLLGGLSRAFPSISDRLAAKNKPIVTKDRVALNLGVFSTGMKGSFTKVTKTWTPMPVKKETVPIDASAPDKGAEELLKEVR